VDDRRRNRAAIRQATVLTAAVLVTAALAIAYARRPADRSDLKIPIGELRSQSAELGMLDRGLADGLGRRFVQAHAGQLGRTIERSRDELASEKTTARLADLKAIGLERSAPLVGAAAALHDGRAPLTDAAKAQIGAAEDALRTLEERLRQ
jgi:hypothetical protein